jgi:hypothetical protein
MKVLLQMREPFQIDISTLDAQLFLQIAGVCEMTDNALIFDTPLFKRMIPYTAIQEMIPLPDTLDLHTPESYEDFPHIGRIN